MKRVHQIRLRGPWEVSVVEAAAGSKDYPPTKMHSPCSWRDGGWIGFSGAARHVRRFGQPPQRDSAEQVWLVIDPCRGQLRIELNGNRLGEAPTGEGFEADVTGLLQSRNELLIEVRGSSEDDGLTGEVRLEIRASD